MHFNQYSLRSRAVLRLVFTSHGVVVGVIRELMT